MNYWSGFRPASTHRNPHKFCVAQLLHTRHSLVQFSDLIRLHVGVDHLGDLGRFAGGDIAGCHRFRDGRHEISGVTGARDRRQRERHRSIFTWRVYSVEAEPQRHRIAIQRHLDGFLRQGFRLAVQ